MHLNGKMSLVELSDQDIPDLLNAICLALDLGWIAATVTLREGDAIRPDPKARLFMATILYDPLADDGYILPEAVVNAMTASGRFSFTNCNTSQQPH